MIITAGLREVLNDAISKFSDMQANAGSNDLEIPNTQEMALLYHQYNKWNSGATSTDDSQYMPFPVSQEDRVIVDDGFQVFLLKKFLNLL